MQLTVGVDQEEDGRFIAEVTEFPDALAYETTREEAVSKVEALALRVFADRLEHDEPVPKVSRLFAVKA